MTAGAGGTAAGAAPPRGGTRRVARAAATSGGAAIVAAVGGVVRVKLLAVFLGAAGVGVVSQIQNLQNTLAVLGMMGLGIGVSREVARARGAGDQEAVRRVLATARGLAGGSAIALAAGVMAAAEPISGLLFDDPGYAWLLRLAAPAVAFGTLSRVVSEVLNGHGDFVTNARFTVASTALAVAWLLPLLPGFGLAGAAAALTAAAVTSWALLAGMFRRRLPGLAAAGARVDRRTAGLLLHLGLASVAMGAADQVALLAIRARLIRGHGLAANGWFQGAWGLSQYILSVAVAFHMSYSFSRVTEAPGHEEWNLETNRTVRMTLLLMAPMTAAMVLLREPLVRVFLSAEFLPALPLFPETAAGTLLRGAGLAVGIGALTVAPVGAWLALGLSGSAAFLAAFLLLAPAGGVGAAPRAFALSGAVYLAATWATMHRRGGLRIERRVLLLGASSAALLAAAAWIADGGTASYVAGAALLIAWGATAVRRHELRLALDAARRRLRGGR